MPKKIIVAPLHDLEQSQGTTAAFTSILRQSNHNNIFPSSSTPTKDYTSPEYCMTPGCVQAAADILSNMDHSVNPCEDFYQFACGGFIEKTVIPDDRTRMSSFSVLSDELLTQVRMILEEESEPNEAKPFRMARDVYKSCMDVGKIQDLGLEPIKQILEELGGWPVLLGPNGTWTSENNYIWYEQVYKFREIGYSVDYLIDFSVTTDLKNSSWRILDLDQPGLGMAREYLMKGLDDPDVQAYQEYMQDVALLLGADKDTVINDIKETIKFEIELAKISLPREERRDASKLYNPMKVSELTTLDPTTPWLEYINTILTTDIVQVSGDEIIIVDVPNYITSFSQLLQTTPKRVQANYLMWRAAAASMAYMNEAADKISLKFSKKLTGKSEEPPRWRKCVGAASGSLANAVGSLYVTKYFNEDSKAEALMMVSEIRRQFERLLDEVDWMDEDTKRQARVKAQGMVEHIGYPSELLDQSKLEELYAGLELSPNAYLGNALNMTVFGTNYAFSKLREKVNKTDWVRHGRPAVVNAFYSPLENSIQFPAGILQGIFFSSDRPKYMNYGAIGWVIGHEITHGFDDQGRRFDKEGNLVNWWDEDTGVRYVNKASCMVEQYSRYSYPELGNITVNGVNTLGENIADNGGIKEAYRAYESWVAQHGEEPLLPGLNFTPSQLFWISAANVWCAKHRPGDLKMSVLLGSHTPANYRIRGTFSNLQEFSQAFQCRKGSKMNPLTNQKCQVW